ncbi:MAG: polysaccharide biosynthesis tyrosine autokinase [Candidatus Baltobacteraceae bacterium]
MSHLTPYARAHVAGNDERPQRPGSDAADLLHLLATVRRRWRLFVAIAGGFVALIALATLLTPKSYTTTVRLMAGRPSSEGPRGGDTALPVLNALVLQSGEQSSETLAELAQQRDIASSVVDTLSLPTSPQGLLSHVSVKPIVNTPLLNLNVSWSSPERSAQIANAFADAFIDQERNFVKSEAVAALGFLSKELPRAELRMRQTSARLAAFQSAHGFVDAAAHEQEVITRMGSIDQRIDQLTVDKSEAATLLANVNGQLASMSSTIDSAQQFAPDPVAANLRAKLSDTQTQLADAQGKYTPSHPVVIALLRQRASLLALLAAQPSSIVSQTTLAPNPLYQSLQQQASGYRARIDGEQAQLRALLAERTSHVPAMNALPSQLMEFATIREDAARAANVYNALAQKNSDALVAKMTAISDILVVQPATADSATRTPSLVINLAVALIVGLLLALAVVYVVEMIEHRSASADVARRLGLPVIARIPDFSTTNRRLLPWAQSMTIEAFLHLCVTLRLKNRRTLRTLAIVSPCRGDGKSTVSYNLAKAMSTLQTRVLLVDADLRRPTLHEKAACPNVIGLSDVLRGSTSLGDAVQTIAASLDILTSGAPVSNPVVLLETRLAELLKCAQASYEMIIVDAPAMANVTDGLLIATHVDGTLLIVAANSTDEREAHNVVAQMAALGIDNVLGIVANRDTARVNDYGDYFTRSSGVSLTGGAA